MTNEPGPYWDDGDEETRARRALVRLSWIFSGVVLAVIGVFFWQGSRSVPHGSGSSGIPGDTVRQATPPASFRDVTRAAGIDFVHFNGARGEKLLPETMGGGVGFFDYDRDGDADLFLVNGTRWPWDSDSDLPPPTGQLYRNDTPSAKEPRFVRVTEAAGLGVSLYGMGVAVGDFDNDGFPDLYITAVGTNRLFHNLGNGRFEDVTEVSGTGGDPEDWGTSAGWFDFDHDGDLDLFVCNYVRWSREIDRAINYHLTGIGKAYGPPLEFEGSFPYLFRNEGGGRFSEVSAAAGLQITNRASGKPLAKSLGISPVDLDHDGWLDIVVANDTVQNFVFHNQRDGTFRETGAVSGLAFDNYGGTRGAMGIDAARMFNDDQLAIAIGNFANEMTALYIARPDAPLFADEAIRQGVGAVSREPLTFGVFFFDYDLDSRLDLLTVNGHIEPEIARFDPAQQYRQLPQLFWNSRGHFSPGSFVLVPPGRGSADFHSPLVGRGSAYADIDLDGDLDIVISQINGPPKLLLNELAPPRKSVRIILRGRRSNRDAIGALLRVRWRDHFSWRRVMPTRGYLSQSELPVTLGLGNGKTPRSIEVYWPSGLHQEVPCETLSSPMPIEEPGD